MNVLELTSSATPEFDQGEVYFIGNATTLIRFGGLTILTDPAFLHKGEHVHLGHGIWARREVEPACQVARCLHAASSVAKQHAQINERLREL